MSLRARASDSPFAAALVACILVAALSAAVLPTVPSYDPFSWIVWGREVFDSSLSFTVSGGPSWKPLPFVFTSVYGLFGGAAPTLWVITARVGGLMSLVAAYRLAARLVGDEAPPAAGPIAGVVAAAGVALTQEFAYYMFRGTSEPMLVGCTLWAIDRHLAGRHIPAFLLGIGASLIRPEAWPFVGLYGLWLMFGPRPDPRSRAVVLLGWLAIPVGWFVPPWIGSGQPFLAASHAKDYNGHLGSDPFLEVLRRGADLQVLPLLILGLAAVGFALYRRGRTTRPGDRVILALAAGAGAWWVLVVGMTLDGYPGLERFFLPAAGVICVLGGAGVIELARLLRTRAVQLGGAVALALLAGGLSYARIDRARAQEPIAARAVTRIDSLGPLIAALGGRHAMLPCHRSQVAINHGIQTAFAWKLHVTLERVGTSVRRPGLNIIGPHDTIDGGPAHISPRLTSVVLLRTIGVWRVYRVTEPGRSTACVGR